MPFSICSVLAALGGSCHMTFHLGKQSIPTLRGVMRRKPSAESGNGTWKKIHDALHQECLARCYLRVRSHTKTKTECGHTAKPKGTRCYPSKTETFRAACVPHFRAWQDGRELEPSAAILDSQSVKTTEKGGLKDMTPINMLRDANGISWWTQWALLLLSLSVLPACKSSSVRPATWVE